MAQALGENPPPDTEHPLPKRQVVSSAAQRSKCVTARRAGLSGQTLEIGNGGGKQGRGNQHPNRRYGPDTEFQYRPPPGSYTDLQNQAEVSPKGKPMRNFSIDPTSSIPLRAQRLKKFNLD